MDQMTIDVYDAVSILLVNEMSVPDFFKKSFWHSLILESVLITIFLQQGVLLVIKNYFYKKNGSSFRAPKKNIRDFGLLVYSKPK